MHGYCLLQADSILKDTPDKSGAQICLRHVIGFAIWLVGWVINLHSDNVLRLLRNPGETGESERPHTVAELCTRQCYLRATGRTVC